MTADDSPHDIQDSATAPDYIRWLDDLWSERLLTARDRKADLSVGILLWPTFPMMSLTGLIEPLRHAADFADNSRPLHCRWSIMGPQGRLAFPRQPFSTRDDFLMENGRITVLGGSPSSR